MTLAQFAANTVVTFLVFLVLLIVFWRPPRP